MVPISSVGRLFGPAASGAYQFHSLNPLRVDPDALLDFQCDSEAERRYLQQQAIEHQEKRVANTTLVYNQGVLVAFVTLAVASLELDAEAAADRGWPSILPVLKLVKFAVDSRYRRQNHGATAIAYAVDVAQHVSLRCGCRFLAAYTPAYAKTFLERMGFVQSQVTSRAFQANRSRVLLLLDPFPPPSQVP